MSQSIPLQEEPLTTGTKAGIGVGSALGALVLMGLAVFIYKKLKREGSALTEHELAAKSRIRTSEIEPGTPPAGRDARLNARDRIVANMKTEMSGRKSGRDDARRTSEDRLPLRYSG